MFPKDRRRVPEGANFVPGVSKVHRVTYVLRDRLNQFSKVFSKGRSIATDPRVLAGERISEHDTSGTAKSIYSPLA